MDGHEKGIETLLEKFQELQQKLLSLETAYKKTEENLQEIQEKYRGLSEASFEAIFISEKGLCIEQNLAAEKMFGYTIEEALTRYGTEWIVPEDRDMVMANMLSGNEKPYEATALRKDGSTFPCVLHGKMMRYKGRDVRVTSLNDITERKQTEIALQESELRFSLFMDYLPAVVFLKDHEGRTLFINKYMQEVFSANDWLGKTMEDVFPNEFGEKLTVDDLDAIAQGYLKIEESMMHLDGRLHCYETQKFTIIRPGKHPLLGGISLDITERKEIEKQVLKVKEDLEKTVEKRTADLVIAKNRAEESEEKFRLIFNSGNDAVFVHGLDSKGKPGLIINVNDVACEKYGYSKEEFLKITPYKLDDKEIFKKNAIPAIQKLLAGESATFESIHQTKEGRKLNVEISSRFFELQGENVVLSIVRDITERKKTEKAAIESQRLMAMGEMAASVAHDFNNSLQAMQGNIEIIKSKSNFSPTSQKHINTIETLISDVSSRVKTLQQFGDTKHNSSSYKIVNLNTIISEVLLQLRPMWKDQLEKEGLIVNVITKYCDTVNISCNGGELKTAFYNVLKNSIEAMPYGGTLTIETSIKDEEAFVTVKDTGVGMDEETKMKIFQPFYTTKGFDVGRGLGMSGVYSIIKNHGGNIFVAASEPDKGTTVNLVFPIRVNVEIQNKKPRIKETIPHKESILKILWVEDDESIRENGAELIELIGHNCDTANSGKKALEYLDKNRYDIVLTDIGMPDMNGWQLADAIKEKFEGKMAVVVVSGWNISNQEKEKHGIKFALAKPFSIADLKKIFLNFQDK